MKTESDNNNQWCVSSVDEFLQYCCPDCDLKEKNKEDFVKHALSQHPMSANYLGQIIIKEELFEDSGELKNEIITEFDPGFLNDNGTDDLYTNILPDEPEINITTNGGSIAQIVHEGKKKWTCNICNNLFTIKQSAKQHVLNIHKLETEDNVKDHHELIENETTSPKSMKYECESCDKSFTQSIFLKQHIKRIHNEKHFNCDFCDKNYTTTRKLMEHKRKVHRDEIKQETNDSKSSKSRNSYECYSCEFCGTICAHKQTLQKHIKNIHENQPTIVCDLCGKMFRSKTSLKDHILCIHEGRKDHKCSQCGREFSQSGTLNTHIKLVHEGKKDKICNLCGKQFGTMSQLKAHMDAHLGIKRIQCQFCDQSFRGFTGRKKHMLKMHPTLFKPTPKTSQ